MVQKYSERGTIRRYMGVYIHTSLRVSEFCTPRKKRLAIFLGGAVWNIPTLRNQSFAVWAIQQYKIVYNINFSFDSDHHKLQIQITRICPLNIQIFLFMIFFQIQMNGYHSSQSGPMENPELLEKIGRAQIFFKKSDIEVGKIRGLKTR
jgi:hypothetical protein